MPGPTFAAVATQYDVPTALLESLAWQTSAWDADKIGEEGRVGIAQLRPSTVDYINDELVAGPDLDPTVPAEGIELMAAYVDELLHQTDGSWAATTAAYRLGLSAATAQNWDGDTIGFITTVLGGVANLRRAEVARAEPLGKAAGARYDHVPPATVQRAKVKLSRRLPRQADAMTVGRTIYVRPGHEQSQGLLAHELVHVRQWQQYGSSASCVATCGRTPATCWRSADHMAAYRAIPFEAEAREEAAAWKARQH